VNAGRTAEASQPVRCREPLPTNPVLQRERTDIQPMRGLGHHYKFAVLNGFRSLNRRDRHRHRVPSYRISPPWALLLLADRTIDLFGFCQVLSSQEVLT
jgi:hypothetical protein